MDLLRRLPLSLFVIALIVWAIGGATYFDGLRDEHRYVSSKSDLSCPIPGQDSVFAPSRWQSWPPGRVCIDGQREYDRPGLARALGVVGVPVGLLLLLGATGFRFAVWWRTRQRT